MDLFSPFGVNRNNGRNSSLANDSDFMKKEIIVLCNGNAFNITKTALISDYLKLNYIPETDKLLDWRSALMKLRTDKSYPAGFIELEIKATDYLLKEQSNE